MNYLIIVIYVSYLLKSATWLPKSISLLEKELWLEAWCIAFQLKKCISQHPSQLVDVIMCLSPDQWDLSTVVIWNFKKNF